MLKQTNSSALFVGFFTAGKVPKTGLTVTVTIYRDNVAVVTGAAATEIGRGLYMYRLLAASTGTAGVYSAVFETTDATVDLMGTPGAYLVGDPWVQNIDASISSIATAVASVPANVWNYLTSLATTAGSMGKRVVDYLDVNVNSRSSFQAKDVWAVVTSTTGTTAAGTFGKVVTDDATNNVAVKAKTDLIPAQPAAVSNIPTVSDIATGVWAATTRTLSAFGFTVNTNANSTETAIKAKTDVMPSASDVAAAVWGATTRTLSGFGTLVGDIWGNATRSLTDKSGFGLAGTQSFNNTGQTDSVPAQVKGMDVDTVSASALASGAVTEIQANLAKQADVTGARDTITAAVGTARDTVTAAIGNLNNLSTAHVQNATTEALTNYGAMKRADATSDKDVVLAAIATRMAQGEQVALSPDERTALVQSIFSGNIEGTLTLKNALRVALAVLAGNTDGSQSAEITFRNVTDTMDMVKALIDADGNRHITLNL